MLKTAARPGHQMVGQSCSSVTGKGNREIYSMEWDGSYLQRLTKNDDGEDSEDRSPVWTVDGSKIVFQSNRSGIWEEHVMYADGTWQWKVDRELRSYVCP